MWQDLEGLLGIGAGFKRTERGSYSLVFHKKRIRPELDGESLENGKNIKLLVLFSTAILSVTSTCFFGS
jgi:hypothetical protein